MKRKTLEEQMAEWTVTICYIDYETGKPLDTSKFTPEELLARKKIVHDKAMAAAGYYPVKTKEFKA